MTFNRIQIARGKKERKNHVNKVIVKASPTLKL